MKLEASRKGRERHTVLMPSWPCRGLQGAPPGVAILFSSEVLVWRTQHAPVPAQHTQATDTDAQYAMLFIGDGVALGYPAERQQGK